MKWRNIDRKKLLANIYGALEHRKDIIEDIINHTSNDEKYLVQEFFNDFPVGYMTRRGHLFKRNKELHASICEECGYVRGEKPYRKCKED